MKSSFMRPALALALALGLAACGGTDKAMFTVGGTVGGLQYPGLVLTTNGADLSVAPPATAGSTVKFEFPKQIEYGDQYNVQIKQQPLHQTCQTLDDPTHEFANNRDTAGRLAQIDVIVNCFINQFTIGGKISGLTADGLILANGSTGGTVAPAKEATEYTFGSNTVPYGVTYGVTVLQHPTGQVCQVANGTGTMGDANVTNIDVSCVPAS